MSGGKGRGAAPHVQRALGWSGETPTRHRVETANCQLCSTSLRFFTGEFGQSLEQCENTRCFNHRPHRPQPDLSQTKRGR